MSDINERYSIDNELTIPEDFDIYALRDKGIKLIQQYSGTTWTDHNLHDPGITILEQICYALADVSYQTTQAIESAISSNQFANSPYFSQQKQGSSSFFTFEDLSNIILTDERIYKVFVIPSISYPTVTGIYDLVIFCEQGANREEIKKWVTDISNQWRPLCTKIETIHLPPIKPIVVDLEVEVNSQENIQDILQTYILVIKEFLKGKNKNFSFFDEQITDPVSFSKKIGIQLQAADLVAAINRVKFTKDIIHIKLKDPEQEFIWTLSFDVPFELTIDPKSMIRIKYSGTTIQECTNKQLFQFDKKAQYKRKITGDAANTSSNRYTQFSSLQTGMPAVFDLEREFKEPLRQDDAGSLQLKGILTVYDLLISNYISKLEVIYSFLNKKHLKFADLAEDMLLKIPGIEWVWVDFIEKFEEVKVTKKKPHRYQYWKSYLSTYKDKLHEMVSMSSRTELDNIEQLISSYLYLLQLMGFNLELIAPQIKQLTALDKAIYLERLLEFWISNKNFRVHTQNSFHQTSIQPSSTGYRGLLSSILNFNFDTFSFSQHMLKLWTRLQNNNSESIPIKQITSIKDFFIFGRNERNYLPNDQSITLIKGPEQPIAVIDKLLSKEELIDLTRRLKEIHDKSDGFLLIEHAILAPDLDETVFGLNCKIDDGLYFYIDPIYSVQDIYKRIGQMESHVKNNTFELSIKAEGKKQYCIYFTAEEIEYKIDKFYGSENDAETDAQHITKVLRNSGIKFQIIDYLYYRYANQIDPYSFTISLCFPNWIDKFNSPAQINSVLQIIDKITPAHLVVRCNWFNPKEFEFLMENFTKLTKGKSIETDKNTARINLSNLLMRDERKPADYS